MKIPQETRLQLNSTGFGPWLEKQCLLVPEKIAEYGWSVERLLPGGKSGICLLVRNRQCQLIVVKVMPAVDLERQAIALESFDGNFTPQLIGYSLSDDMLWIEYLSGHDRPKAYKVDELIGMFDAWQGTEACGQLPSVHQHAASWLDRLSLDDFPVEIQQARQTARIVMQELPLGNKLLHGDMGHHNMFRLNDGGLVALDPAGAQGDIEWDIACAAFLFAPKREFAKCDLVLQELCNALEADLDKARAWAVVRTACSAGFGWGRGENEFVADALAAHNDWLALLN